jgi:anti-anti-sigma factor
LTIKIASREHLIKVIIITLEGRLDAAEAPAVNKLCNEYIENGLIYFVFDLREVSMLDSAGLAVFVNTLKRARIKDGDVRLVFPTAENALRVLKMNKFDQVFQSIDRSQIETIGN